MNKSNTSKILVMGGLFALAACIFAPRADAACVAGLPCVTPMTPNYPNDGEITPNTSGENAAKSESELCDADFMNQIYARSMLHAEREHGMLQTILRKPDSVLEYSCFETHLNMAASRVPRTFSETTRFSSEYFDEDMQDGDGWGPGVASVTSTFNFDASDCLPDDYEEGEYYVIGLDCERDDDHEPEADDDHENDPIDSELEINVYMSSELGDDETRLGNLLENLVLKSLVDSGGGDDSGKYIDSNFYHPYMGGGMLVDTPATNNSFTGEIELEENYTCLAMNVVWQFAKCRNFGVDDQMLGFAELGALDTRLLPQTCEGDYDPIVTAEYIPVAANEGAAFVHFDSSRLTEDNTQMYSHILGAFNPTDDQMRYSDFTQTDECLDPIPTGVQVKTYTYTTDLAGIVNTEAETHAEHVCPTVGCYYNKDSGECVP